MKKTERNIQMIRLEDIDPGNWREGLKVSPRQEKYVASDMKLLARAYAYRNERSYACIICDDDTPVGMALYYDCDELNAYDFSQLFIDERYQRNGYGKAAAKLLLEKMKADKKYSEVVLCYIEGNDIARKMYEDLGFYHTGEVDDDEIVMRKKL
jgi:diamine N-acetyltransferase